MSWTTDDLVTAIKNSQMFPDASSGSLSPAAMLQYATEELYITILPMMMGIREKYYEKYLDTLYSTSTPYLNIPSRSVGGTLSVVQYLVGIDVRPLEPIDPGSIATTSPTSEPTNFYFENNNIVFYPPPNTSNGTVRMRYFQRPSRLEQITNCAQITAFDPLTGVATCTPVSTWTAANTFDFIPKTASQATPYNLDSAISAISATTITFTLTAAPAALVNVGDWIALAEYTPIPEIPFELQPVLMQATCCRGLAALNDQTALQSAKAILKEYMDAATKILTPRDQGGNKKVVSNWRRF
jgi:hypothetical protein